MNPETIRKYGNAPYRIALLHGGPGAAGEMKPVALELLKHVGVLECLQTEDSVTGQVEELYNQLKSTVDRPIILAGYSWGAWLGVLFAVKYPLMVEKLILISSGVFEDKYNTDLLNARMNRLTPEERKEAIGILDNMKSGTRDNELLARFGVLMDKADTYCPIDDDGADNDITINMDIHSRVWAEAAELRTTGKLKEALFKLVCPVVVIHGDHDPHSLIGVVHPVEESGKPHEIIILENCGHTPWREKYAKKEFYEWLHYFSIS